MDKNVLYLKMMLQCKRVCFDDIRSAGATELFGQGLSFMSAIMKTRKYNLNPLKPHFYQVKLEFTGVHIIFFLFF